MINILELDDAELEDLSPMLLDAEDFKEYSAMYQVRPREPHLVQLEMLDMDLYNVYVPPDKVLEFHNPENLERWLNLNLKDAVNKDELIRIGLAVMANFKLVNLNKLTGRIERVYKPRLSLPMV